MIVDNLYVICVAVRPYEAYAPLLVDPDAHLPGPISSQRFEAVSRRAPEIVQSARGIDLPQLSQSPILNIAGKSPAHPAVPYAFGFLTFERSDHSAARNIK
jgi:hypothetical protein